MSAVERLPFDQYQRYRLVADILGRLRRGREALTVLDVGGRTALLRRFLTDERVTLVDVEPSETPEHGLVLGDGRRLPFADGAFDVVCAFDTLEHVPPGDRVAFVAECRRVTRSWVVLAGPYDAPRVREAEALLTRFLADKLGMRHRYLGEHAAHGLPSRGAVEEQLASLGGRVTRVGHANLERWLALMCLAMFLDADPALRGLAEDVFAFYNASLYASDHAEPVYRHAVVGAFGDALLPSFDGLLAPARAPSGSLAAFQELTEGLCAFDRERAVWRAERAAFEQTAAELAAELDGERAERLSLGRDLARHRAEAQATAEELAARIAEHEEQAGVLETDLASHRASLAELEALLAEERTARADEQALYARQVREYEDQARALQAELAAERAAFEAGRADLERQLVEHRAVVEHRESLLAEHREVLAHRDALLADLRARLLGRLALKLVERARKG